MEYTEKDMFGIEGEVAVLTGAAGGIGQEIAAAMAALGAKVALADLNREKLEESVGQITKNGGEAMGIVTDVTNKKSVEEMAKAVYDKHGKIDILVNCAGIAHLQDAVDFEEDIWDKVMAVNVKGTLLPCQVVGRYMLEKEKGRIVNISSVRGMQGRARDLAYAPSKGAVDQLTRSLAIEWAKKNINVNAVAPIFTLTDINREMLQQKETMDWVMSRMPKGRLSMPSYLTGPVIFLCGKSSEFITGQVVYVDGGWTCA
ncbi:SDR family NAD(P)-dependent oxidoreductase [Christensenella tenuis]|jgi:NAD(P)-dependent dehydrogenase (short-subunit alcohol dehydrogenase family)|uniref:SDR family oxidoreductase n=1 Tax=Christensenella tenuis TaxID=2763033 RepID=A0ABR7EEL5_9FIRM|nr:SDR family oxidoreductase [Christensenella tenuis]MBC5648217.1 SDR family oxidoreductase [Christensenella tenuis]